MKADATKVNPKNYKHPDCDMRISLFLRKLAQLMPAEHTRLKGMFFSMYGRYNKTGDLSLKEWPVVYSYWLETDIELPEGILNEAWGNGRDWARPEYPAMIVEE